jgi:hypothetical protein
MKQKGRNEEGKGTGKGGRKVRDIEGDRDSDAGAGCTRYRGLVSFLRLRVFGLCSFTFVDAYLAARAYDEHPHCLDIH